MTRAVKAMLVQLLCIAVASAVALTPIKVQSLSAFAQSRAVAHQVGRTAVYVASENIIRVTHDPTDAPSTRASLIARQDWPKVRQQHRRSDSADHCIFQVDYQTSDDGKTVTIRTSKLRVTVEKATGKVQMLDNQGKIILGETRTTFNSNVDIPGDTSFKLTQSWTADEGLQHTKWMSQLSLLCVGWADESLYGGGEYQNGLMDFAGP